ncbi:MAG: alkaline phosphatase family protein, partial [Planctomycetota bacterium]
MDLSRRSPGFRLIRLSASVGVFLWLVVVLQFQLVNALSWSPLLFLLLGGAGFLLLGALGGLFGGLLGVLAGRLPRPLLLAAAILVPLAAGAWALLLPTLASDAFAARKAVLASGTGLAFLLGCGGFLVAWITGRRLRAPLPALFGIVAAWIPAGFLAHEPAAVTRPEKEVRASLKKEEPAAAKLLIFGSDGLEWSVIRDLLERGELPHFREVMDRGVHAPLETMEPTLSPIIWTTLATGVPWEEHGVREFLWFHLPGAACDAGWTGTFLEPLIRRAGRQNPVFLPYIRLTGTVHRRRPAFWEMLDLGRVDCAVVNWWGTQPPIAGNGFQVSDQGVEQALLFAGDLETHPEAQARLETLMRACVAPEDQWRSVAQLFEPERLAAFRKEAGALL